MSLLASRMKLYYITTWLCQIFFFGLFFKEKKRKHKLQLLGRVALLINPNRKGMQPSATKKLYFGLVVCSTCLFLSPLLPSAPFPFTILHINFFISPSLHFLQATDIPSTPSSSSSSLAVYVRAPKVNKLLQFDHWLEKSDHFVFSVTPSGSPIIAPRHPPTHLDLLNSHLSPDLSSPPTGTKSLSLSCLKKVRT
jgi:hypothetical protein